jgi:2-polyprenyl-6-methoxyphenol hydroxylase-like FAD-dependent oxidoreductase
MGGTRAVVLGAGVAGTLAAAALLGHADSITIIDKDTLPAGPDMRAGLPQGRHAHVLMAGGARAAEQLLPGIVSRLISAGARRIGMPNDMVTLSVGGWLCRFPEMQFTIACTRALLDATLRSDVLADQHAELLDNTELLELLGDATRVTGVRVRDRSGGAIRELTADLVIDATGRTALARGQLARLGVPAVSEAVVDPGLFYASRMFRSPSRSSSHWPMVTVQADPATGEPGTGAMLLPVENDQWLVTLSGTAGAHPPTDPAGFLAFARERVRHPMIGELIATATPLGAVHGFGNTANRRRYYESARRWPAGLLVVGDAVATFNPIYGHGMSVAAQSAVLLHGELADRGVRGIRSGKVQRRIGATVNRAWTIATAQDVLYPGTAGGNTGWLSRAQQQFIDRLAASATNRPAVLTALLDAFTLSAPFTGLLRPKTLLAFLRKADRPAPDTPTFTGEELSSLLESSA